MALGHVRTFDDDAVAVLQVLLERGRSASTEGCPQTGNGGAVSYARLVLDLDRAECGEELLDEEVLLVVERRATEVREAQRPADLLALELGLPALAAALDHPVGDHVHRGVEREVLPLGPVRPAVPDAVLAGVAGRELQR